PPLFFLADAPLFRVALGAIFGGTPLRLFANAAFLVRLFVTDPVFLEAHQFFEREENRAFLLFGHGRFFLSRQILLRGRRERYTANTNRKTISSSDSQSTARRAQTLITACSV